MYDMYVPLTGEPSLSYNFEEAKNEARRALEPLGKDYLEHVDYIFNNRVIDVVESQNKVTGAYSGGSYDTDPYELLNWEDNLDSLYTLVHETDTQCILGIQEILSHMYMETTQFLLLKLHQQLMKIF